MRIELIGKRDIGQLSKCPDSNAARVKLLLRHTAQKAARSQHRCASIPSDFCIGCLQAVAKQVKRKHDNNKFRRCNVSLQAASVFV